MKKTTATQYYFGLKFIATGSDTNGKYFMCETTIPAGDLGPPFHSHSIEDEGFYIKKGQLTFTVNDKEIKLNQGEFLNIEKGEKHSWRNETNQDAELIVTFAPAGIEHMFIELDHDISNLKKVGRKYGTDFEV
ncbi:MAG: cupin domain-containing protein [Bacteroidota bacterium]